MEEFRSYKKAIENTKDNDKDKQSRNQESSNQSPIEKRGLQKLVKRTRNNELVILIKDKSEKLEDYLKMGLSNIEGDKKMSREDIKANHEMINTHTRILIKIANAREEYGHLKRITDSKLTHSETKTPKYFMFKDHKKEGEWRPVVAGCSSNMLGVNNLI